MAPTATSPRTETRPEDLKTLQDIGVEPTGIRDVDNAIAKYARRMGGQVDAIQNYRDAMLARAQNET